MTNVLSIKSVLVKIWQFFNLHHHSTRDALCRKIATAMGANLIKCHSNRMNGYNILGMNTPMNRDIVEPRG